MVVRLLWLSLIWAQKPKSAVDLVRRGWWREIELGSEFDLLSLMLPSKDSKILSDLISL